MVFKVLPSPGARCGVTTSQVLFSQPPPCREHLKADTGGASPLSMKSLLETVTASTAELKMEQRSYLQDTCWEEIKPDNSATEPSPGEENKQS